MRGIRTAVWSICGLGWLVAVALGLERVATIVVRSEPAVTAAVEAAPKPRFGFIIVPASPPLAVHYEI